MHMKRTVTEYVTAPDRGTDAERAEPGSARRRVRPPRAWGHSDDLVEGLFFFTGPRKHGGARRAAPTDRGDASPLLWKLATQTPIREIMSDDVVTVEAHTTAAQLRELLLERNIGGVPVIDATGRPIGVVSKTDLLRDACDAARAGAIRVEDIMMPMVFALPATASVSRAGALMAYEGVHRVIALAEDGRVAGVLTALDIAHWLAHVDGQKIPAPRRRRRNGD
jgi:CBS domain-containing protein